MKTTAKKVSKADQLKADIRTAKLVAVAHTKLKRERQEIFDKYADRCQPIEDELKKRLEPIKEMFENEVAPIDESIKEAEEQLIAIGERNKSNRELFVDDNWHFEDADGHYLHVKRKTEVVTGPDFNIGKFIKKFGQYVDINFKIKELMKVFSDADSRPKVAKMDLDLKHKESVELKQSAKRA